MRTPILPIGLVLLLAACNPKPESKTLLLSVTDVAAENLKGNVTQVETDTYLVDSTGKMGDIDEKGIEQFDSAGFTYAYINKSGKDSIKFQNKYEHTATGLMTGMEGANGSGKKTFSFTIEYDSTGKPIHAMSYDSTGKMDIFYKDITINAFGQVVSGTSYHADSTIQGSFKQDYDSIYSVGGTNKDSVGKVTYSGKTKLNDKKDPAELAETIVSKDSTTNKVTTYTYDGWDSHGNWTQQTQTNEKGKPLKIMKRIIMYKE